MATFSFTGVPYTCTVGECVPCQSGFKTPFTDHFSSVDNHWTLSVDTEQTLNIVNGAMRFASSTIPADDQSAAVLDRITEPWDINDYEFLQVSFRLTFTDSNIVYTPGIGRITMTCNINFQQGPTVAAGVGFLRTGVGALVSAGVTGGDNYSEPLPGDTFLVVLRTSITKTFFTVNGGTIEFDGPPFTIVQCRGIDLSFGFNWQGISPLGTELATIDDFAVDYLDTDGLIVGRCSPFTISYPNYTSPGETTNPAYNWTLTDGYGSSESVAVVRTGGTVPVTYAVTAGSLPAFWLLNSGTGEIQHPVGVAGGPTGPGSFEITATDSSATPQTAVATVTFIIV